MPYLMGGPFLASSDGAGGSLGGLSWKLQETAFLNTVSFSCPNEVVSSGTMNGETGASYDVTMRFQGVVEKKAYSGGTNDGTYWYIGGIPTGTVANIYKLKISNPDQTYYLNSGVESALCFAIDYTKTVTIATGAAVVLWANSIDAAEVGPNLSNPGLVAPGVTDPAQPYAGQFINMTVTSVVKR